MLITEEEDKILIKNLFTLKATMLSS